MTDWWNDPDLYTEWEPDDFEELNRNEALDYLNELADEEEEERQDYDQE